MATVYVQRTFRGFPKTLLIVVERKMTTCSLSLWYSSNFQCNACALTSMLCMSSKEVRSFPTKRKEVATRKDTTHTEHGLDFECKSKFTSSHARSSFPPPFTLKCTLRGCYNPCNVVITATHAKFLFNFKKCKALCGFPVILETTFGSLGSRNCFIVQQRSVNTSVHFGLRSNT